MKSITIILTILLLGLLVTSEATEGKCRLCDARRSQRYLFENAGLCEICYAYEYPVSAVTFDAIGLQEDSDTTSWDITKTQAIDTYIASADSGSTYITPYDFDTKGDTVDYLTKTLATTLYQQIFTVGNVRKVSMILPADNYILKWDAGVDSVKWEADGGAGFLAWSDTTNELATDYDVSLKLDIADTASFSNQFALYLALTDTNYTDSSDVKGWNFMNEDSALYATQDDISGFVSATLTEEEVEDFIGAGMAGNTETRITVTYQDADGTFDFVVDDIIADTASLSTRIDAKLAEADTNYTDSSDVKGWNYMNEDSALYATQTDIAGFISATLTEEEVEDFVGGMLGGTETGIAVTYQDGTNDIDFVVDHDAANNFVANEHLDWTGSVGTIDVGNYIEDEDLGVNEAYAAGWDSDADSPEKDDVYDYLHQIDTDDDADVDNFDATNLAAAIVELDPNVDTDDEIIAIINASPSTQIAVPAGGSGAGTFTDGGILLGSGTGAFTALGAASNGQIPVGDGTTDPVLATITGGTGITVTNGAGTISVANDLGASESDPTVDTEGECETEWGAVNILLETEIDASSEMLAIMDDETGTGLLVFATAPTFTTSITIGSAGITEAELEILDGATVTTAELELLTTDVFEFTITDPKNLLGDSVIVFTNGEGATITIDSIICQSTADDYDFDLVEYTQTGAAAGGLVDAIVVDADGTALYYKQETTISHDEIESTNQIWFIPDASDSTNSVHVTGYISW